MLKVNRLSAGYRAAKVISEVSFEMARGERLALLGISGLGKSTLLASLAGSPVSGLWKSGLIELETSEGIAYVSQEQKFVEHWSTENHLGIVNKGKALQLLEKMELPVGVRASSLSGGQKQRLALAMVMAAGPGLLLLDEGFHAIDYDRRRNCFDMLKEAGVAIIFVSHDSFDLEQLAVRSLRLEAGSNGSVLSERP